MRLAICAVLLAAACGDPTGGDDGGGSNLPPGGFCESDSQCESGTVCARDGECIAPEYTTSLTVYWQINSGPANATTCVDANLVLDFFGYDSFDSFGFEPVPCKEGQFFLDKIPTRYQTVELYNESETVYDTEAVANAEVHLNLVYPN
ncbi:MAG TPA: hypothetical protein VGM88_31060 [Kofleriaceae bacterium]